MIMFETIDFIWSCTHQCLLVHYYAPRAPPFDSNPVSWAYSGPHNPQHILGRYHGRNFQPLNIHLEPWGQSMVLQNYLLRDGSFNIEWGPGRISEKLTLFVDPPPSGQNLM